MEITLIKSIINKLLSELKIKYSDFNGVYLFGSRVRNDYKFDSDYDLAILFNRQVSQSFKEEIYEVIYNYLLEFNVFIDAHIYSTQDILNPLTPFRQNIKNQGVFYG